MRYIDPFKFSFFVIKVTKHREAGDHLINFSFVISLQDGWHRTKLGQSEVCMQSMPIPFFKW